MFIQNINILIYLQTTLFIQNITLFIHNIKFVLVIVVGEEQILISWGIANVGDPHFIDFDKNQMFDIKQKNVR